MRVLAGTFSSAVEQCSVPHTWKYLWDLASVGGCKDESCSAVHLGDREETFFSCIVGGDYRAGT